MEERAKPRLVCSSRGERQCGRRQQQRCGARPCASRARSPFSSGWCMRRRPALDLPRPPRRRPQLRRMVLHHPAVPAFLSPTALRWTAMSHPLLGGESPGRPVAVLGTFFSATQRRGGCGVLALRFRHARPGAACAPAPPAAAHIPGRPPAAAHPRCFRPAGGVCLACAAPCAPACSCCSSTLGWLPTRLLSRPRHRLLRRPCPPCCSAARLCAHIAPIPDLTRFLLLLLPLRLGRPRRWPSAYIDSPDAPATRRSSHPASAPWPPRRC